MLSRHRQLNGLDLLTVSRKAIRKTGGGESRERLNREDHISGSSVAGCSGNAPVTSPRTGDKSSFDASVFTNEAAKGSSLRYSGPTPRCSIDVTLRIGSTQSTESSKHTTNGGPLKGGSDRYIGTK